MREPVTVGDLDPDEPVPLSDPDRAQLAAYAARQGLRIPGRALDLEVPRVADLLDVFRRLDALEVPAVPLRHPSRSAGELADRERDPWNAIIRFCEVRGADAGPLTGTRLAVKDNIAVAGVPMTDGKRDWAIVPTEDAPVVQRALDAGATIVAKANLFLSDFGLTVNPRDARLFAGGSSSGSAAAVASGLADAALGADQGGSIRTPAAWCGIVGMKPTHGLVPTSGLMGWDPTVDHVGPMTATVAANAALLEILAGGDPLDLGADGDVTNGRYVDAAQLGVAGLRLGIVTEALEHCSTPILRSFDRAIAALEQLGATTAAVSIPLWADAPTIWRAVLVPGMTAVAESQGQGIGRPVRVNAAAARAIADLHRQGRRVPTLALAYEHLRNVDCGARFVRAQNLRAALRRGVDAHLAHLDLLLTPTTVTGPATLEEVRPGDFRAMESLGRRLITNTAALNLTGHPALSVPAGDAAGAVAGLQVIGRPFDERTVYRAAFAVESALGGPDV